MSKKINKGFQVEAQLTAMRPLVDRGMSVTFHTKEINSDEKSKMMDYLMSSGWLLFKENQIQDEDVPAQDADLQIKTPSQRLRGVLYVIWNEKGRKGEFRDFYNDWMEKIIEKLKITYLD